MDLLFSGLLGLSQSCRILDVENARWHGTCLEYIDFIGITALRQGCTVGAELIDSASKLAAGRLSVTIR